MYFTDSASHELAHVAVVQIDRLSRNLPNCTLRGSQSQGTHASMNRVIHNAPKHRRSQRLSICRHGVKPCSHFGYRSERRYDYSSFELVSWRSWGSCSFHASSDGSARERGRGGAGEAVIGSSTFTGWCCGSETFWTLGGRACCGLPWKSPRGSIERPFARPRWPDVGA
jgi:hypothetical protein